MGNSPRKLLNMLNSYCKTSLWALSSFYCACHLWDKFLAEREINDNKVPTSINPQEIDIPLQGAFLIDLMHWRHPTAILVGKRWRNNRNAQICHAAHRNGQWTTSFWPLGECALLKWRHVHKVYCNNQNIPVMHEFLQLFSYCFQINEESSFKFDQKYNSWKSKLF